MGRRVKGQPAGRGRVSLPSKGLPLLTRPPFKASAGLECLHGWRLNENLSRWKSPAPPPSAPPPPPAPGLDEASTRSHAWTSSDVKQTRAQTHTHKANTYTHAYTQTCTHAHTHAHAHTHTYNTHTQALTSCLGLGATAPGLGIFTTPWITLKAVPGNPEKFYRLFRDPLNKLGTQCSLGGSPKNVCFVRRRRFVNFWM